MLHKDILHQGDVDSDHDTLFGAQQELNEEGPSTSRRSLRLLNKKLFLKKQRQEAVVRKSGKNSSERRKNAGYRKREQEKNTEKRSRRRTDERYRREEQAKNTQNRAARRKDPRIAKQSKQGIQESVPILVFSSMVFPSAFLISDPKKNLF